MFVLHRLAHNRTCIRRVTYDPMCVPICHMSICQENIGGGIWGSAPHFSIYNKIYYEYSNIKLPITTIIYGCLTY